MNRQAHGIDLVLYSDAGRWLTEAIECNPRMMVELGGPITREEATEVHRRRLATIASDQWWFKITVGAGRASAGMIGIWPSEHEGESVDEVGWMVLPAFQGRGIASAALELPLDRARAARRFERVHAFPAVTNGPSNALCRKFGFVNLGERDIRFRDRHLRCNHWELALRAPGRAAPRVR